MKAMNKTVAVLLAVAMLVCMTGFTAKAATKATSITFAKTFDAQLRVGYAITREAVTTPEGLTVTYTSSNPAVATVNENGKVVGKKPGKAVITATSGTVKASYNVTVVAADEAAPASTSVFDGYNVTVLDKTTPAVNLYTTQDLTKTYFVSAAGKEVGMISYSDFTAIMKKNSKLITYPSGATQGIPPVDGKSWEEWYADEFNSFRGISIGSKEASINETKKVEAASNAVLAVEYRDEFLLLTNSEREKVGIDELTADPYLMELAQERAIEQSILSGHTRPDGTKVVDLGYGENIQSSASTPSGAISRLMGSTGHRRNILLKDYTRIGVACYITDDSITWIQIFAFDSTWYSE